MNDKVFAKEDLGRVFENSPQAMEYYKKGILSRKDAKSMYIIGSSFIATSAVFLILTITSFIERTVHHPSTMILGELTAAFFAVGVLINLISIPYYLAGSSKLKSAVDQYNNEVDLEIGQKVGSLNLSITNNGFGLVYSF